MTYFIIDGKTQSAVVRNDGVILSFKSLLEAENFLLDNEELGYCHLCTSPPFEGAKALVCQECAQKVRK